MKKIFISILLFSVAFISSATHNRSGEITYRHISGYTYEVTITTYTKTSSIQADRPVLDSVNWGDGTKSVFTRSTKTDLPNDISVNIYINQHPYPGMGAYKINFEDPNRDQGICNMPTSVDVPFCVECYIVVFDASQYCVNNSVYFDAMPITFATLGKDYRQNLTAIDPDGDSLSYELTPCLGAGGLPIPGYTIPSGVSVNPVSGEFVWKSSGMDSACMYNFAVRIKEWRRGYNVGYVERDFQFILQDRIYSLYYFGGTVLFPADAQGNYVDTVSVGDTLNLSFFYADTLDTAPEIYAYGEAFHLSPPSTFNTVPGVYIVNASAQWIPDSADVRSIPYVFTFRGVSPNRNTSVDLTYTVYVPGVRIDTCPAFPFISVLEYTRTNFHLQITPNPFQNKITIHLPTAAATATATIYNTLGEIVYTRQLSTNHYQLSIDLSSLNQGIYFLSVQAGDEVYRGKMVRE